MAKIMEIISKETGGKSYNTEKYSYDTIGMPSFDYDDDGEKFIKWQVSGEAEKHKTYVDLTNEAKRQIGKRPVISYFLDGSRHTYKVDDISYNKKVYPVIAGQVGIGCCKRTDGRMRPEKFYRRLVLSLPTVSNADGWKDDVFFAAQTKKLNKSEELKKLGIEFATILPYGTDKRWANHLYPVFLTESYVKSQYMSTEMFLHKYPANNAYFAYMTRGCINHCAFCAVPKLEPHYCDYIGLKEQIERARDRFGEQRDLLLLDNNVLASKCYDRIIDEIKACGFQKGATYMPPDQYEIAIQNLKDGYNDRAYVRKCIRLYKELTEKLPLEEKTELYLRLEQAACLHYETATKEEILKLDEFVAPLFKKHFKHTKKVKRIVDFNQGIDARLINDQNMAKLAEINISPLRIAFDHWEQKDIYEKAVRTAVAHGITNLSNYMLYNFRDKPEHLYYRMKLNVDLCDELGANIYSFPMKYHPINDPDFFMNRDYIGEHWNRKFIRAIQAVLNSTKGKVGKGKHFFEEAFGADEHRFWTILWMPETFIIYRFMFKEDLAKEWEEKFWSLPTEELEKVKSVVAVNKFKDLDFSKYSKEARDVLQYYMVTRDEAEQMLKEKNS